MKLVSSVIGKILRGILYLAICTLEFILDILLTIARSIKSSLERR